MNIIVTFINLFAFLLGVASIAIAIKLLKNYNYQFLTYYLYFLICSVISGFFDWVSFNWVWFFGSNFTSLEVEAVYHIFWDFLGFPGAIFASYFLLVMLSKLVDFSLNIVAKRILLAIVFTFTLLSYISISLRMFDAYNPLGIPLWIVFLYLLPIINLTILFYAYTKTVDTKSTPMNYVHKFILILFAGYALWYTVMLSTANLGVWTHLIILIFYIMLLVPTLYLYKYFGSRESQIKFSEENQKRIEIFFDKYEFTNREKEIIDLIINSKSNRQIADELFISEQTVKNYVSKIYRKLNLNGRLELVNFIRNFTEN